ncbi:hypothetical protein [Hymenobacter psychrophilus]|uniref:Uncharacterized protein n=1 Tax=Hymenobacter psychrophilus TaxID=651662 RepID=A0A1H3PBV2_9BACT|nr:hypothetical protein [Hymenobacter psychrophilus]SDY98567.1 hypothetical protein SAMN04488069_1282 [Hymenobacter psychrophilus]
MKNSINNKVNALKKDAENQGEFMKKLAQLDEQGQLTDAMLEQISGGEPGFGVLIDVPMAGMWNPDPVTAAF